MRNLNENEEDLYRFAITLTLTGSILSFIPSFGRFTIVGLLLLLIACISILLKVNYSQSRCKLFSRLGFLASLLIIPTNIWILSTFSIHTILGNYFTVFIDDQEILYSIFDLIKEIIT